MSAWSDAGRASATDTATPTVDTTIAACCDKATLRAELTARRNRLTDVDRTETVAVMLPHLTALPEWQTATIVCGYVATRGELDLTPVWKAAVASGKTYALPVCVSGVDAGQMVFRATPGLCPERLTRRRFDIAEPPAQDDFPVLFGTDGICRDISHHPHVLILLPGLGFDDDGYRLGYGGGYYDRILATLSEADLSLTTVGLCHSSCRVPRLPRSTHDRPADLLIDERSVTRP